jgi:hypothetical protein
MEFIEGTSLARLVAEQGPLPVAVASDYARQAALGLQHAFEHGPAAEVIPPRLAWWCASRSGPTRPPSPG